jgi:hypothetical protein
LSRIGASACRMSLRPTDDFSYDFNCSTVTLPVHKSKASCLAPSAN